MKITRKKITASSVDKRLSFTSTKYKGYRISLDHKNNCYNIYDKHGELEDSGFTSQLDAKKAIDKLSKESEVNSSKRQINPTSKIVSESYPYIKWVKKAEDGSWVMWGGSYSSDIDPDFLDRINHPNFPNPEYNIENQYTDYIVLPSGQTPDEVLASREITSDEDIEYLDNEDTLRELIDELAENGVDIYDDQDILQELGANYGYDRDDQFAILEDIRDYVGQGINSAEDVDYTTETASDFDTDSILSSISFFKWYDALPEESQEAVDDIADSEGITFYDQASDEDLAYLKDRYESTHAYQNYVYSSEESEKLEDDELETTEQEFSSKDTSINSSKLPAIYKLVNFPKGSVVLDFGGGRYDNGVEYLNSIGCEGYVYDPYNRTSEHNSEVVKAIRANGGADIVLNSNVLNVIKEAAARRTVLKNIKKLVKPSGKVYITVYEGNGSGQGKQSKADSFQLNRKTADYLEEIQEVFPDATRKGKLIIATPNGTPVKSSTDTSIPVSDLNEVMMRAADIHDRKELIGLLGDLASIDQKMYQHYCDLDQSGEYSPAAIGKMISDELYWKLDKINSCSTIESASYGGAFDIKDDQFFTQEELYEFAYEIEEKFNSIASNGPWTFYETYLTPSENNLYEIGLTNNDVELDAKLNIDMRRIHKPSDIHKYTDEILNQLIYHYNQYYEPVESSTCMDTKKEVESSDDLSKENLSSQIMDYLDECGGYTDYNQKIEDLVEEFNLDRDTAENYVWNWASGIKDMYEEDDIESCDSITSREVPPYKRSEFVKELQDELYDACSKRMQEYDMGFPLEEVANYLVVEVTDNGDAIVAEIRSELDYEGMDKLAEVCNPIVEKYDKNAYFDHVEPGIIESYIFSDAVFSKTDVNSEEYIDYENPVDAEKIYQVEFDNTVTLEDNIMSFKEGEIFDNIEDEDYNGIEVDDADGVSEKILDLITYNVPEEDGTYRVSGIANLKYFIGNTYEGYSDPDFDDTLPGNFYDVSNIDISYDPRGSWVENLQVEKI